jgi:UDP-N-acetylglucosamine 2-epimerase
MGESPDRVHWVGAPGLDRLYELIHERRHFRSVSRSTARAVLAARNHRPVSADESCERPFALIVQHPCGRSARQEFDAMTAILNAVDGIGLRRVVIYPNSDRGHSGILDAIKCHKLSQSAETHVVRSLARDDYLRLLLDARVLMGNSSSGIIEAPAAGTPVVNVGGRQAGRLRGGPCVVDAEENERSIRSALRKALAMHPRRGGRTPYGDGQAGRRIAEHVAEVPLDDRLRRKHPLPTRIMPPRKARDRSRRAGIDPRHLISRPTPATRRPSGLERNVRLRAWTCFSALLG